MYVDVEQRCAAAGGRPASGRRNVAEPGPRTPNTGAPNRSYEGRGKSDLARTPLTHLTPRPERGCSCLRHA
eukprot:1526417-Prymnesium_polylepis.1